MTWFDRIALAGVTAVAAFLRFRGIESRGPFDADQGKDMLTLVAFTRDGVVPLLGPKTSVGEFHHGAFYYFLLAPSAALSDGDPVGVTVFIALLGIAAVALTWWLGRAIGGPVAGFLAGMLLAVSPGAIEESTFIWNPNPIGFFAILALAAAWRGHTGGGPAWWAVALGAAGAVAQLHVLGLVFLIAIVALGLLELRRDRGVAISLLGGLGIIVLLFVPLLVHELQSGFAETRGVLEYLRAGDEIGASPLGALTFTLLRIVGWPTVGLVTDAPQLAAIMLAVTVGLAVIGLRMARGTEARGHTEATGSTEATGHTEASGSTEATGLRWLIGMLVWGTVALAFVAPGLQRVVAGLPNDHYHAFLDPVVVLLIAIPAAGLFTRASSAWRSTRRPAWLGAVLAIGAGLALIVVVALERKPPQVHPDGGWAAAQAAGIRIVAAANGAPVTLLGLPVFKSSDGIRFPVERAGGQIDETVNPTTGTAVLVMVCDRLFDGIVDRPCGGPAEDDKLDDFYGASETPRPTLVERFDASPSGRISISIYRP